MKKKLVSDFSGYSKQGFEKLIKHHKPTYLFHTCYTRSIMTIYEDEHLLINIGDLYDVISKEYKLCSLFFYSNIETETTTF